MRIPRVIFAMVALVIAASAHVSVSPKESKAGTAEKYTVRVPTEGKVSTVSVDLEVPAGLTVTSVSAPEGAVYETKKENGRIVLITWKLEIKPGDMAELVFNATNPSDAASLAWKAHQHFADKTTADWTGPAGDRRPAAITKLLVTQ